MFKFYVITFVESGKTAILRSTVIGPHAHAAIMSKEGTFESVESLPAFRTSEITHFA